MGGSEVLPCFTTTLGGQLVGAGVACAGADPLEGGPLEADPLDADPFEGEPLEDDPLEELAGGAVCELDPFLSPVLATGAVVPLDGVGLQLSSKTFFFAFDFEAGFCPAVAGFCDGVADDGAGSEVVGDACSDGPC